ncbi:MAG TPA: flagellar export chaperone FliS [Armatimonadota bacterium]|nr:flagellar export chaperone FliS [Armatimonadota bacterium]
MAALKANAYYQASQVNTASRGTLLVLAYDGLLRFLAEGKRAMLAKQIEVQNTNLTKAQSIIVELINTLDPTANPQLAESLKRLYTYMYDRLVYANVHDDEAAIMEVAGMLSELREAWAEADRIVRSQEGGGYSSVGGHAV